MTQKKRNKRLRKEEVMKVMMEQAGKEEVLDEGVRGKNGRSKGGGRGEERARSKGMRN